MVIFLYGSDSYRRNKKLKELLGAYRTKYLQSDLKIIDFEEEEDGWRVAKDFLAQESLFVDSKVLVVKNTTLCDETLWAETLKAYRAAPKTFIIISDEKEPKKSFSFLLQEPVQFQHFEELGDRILEMFIQKESDLREITFDSGAKRFFYEYILGLRDRSWNAVHELEKIALAGFKMPIALHELSELITLRPGGELFKIVRELLFSKDQGKKMSLLEYAFIHSDPAYVFNSLGYQARDNDAVRLAEYDALIKSGALEYEEALTEFVLR